MSPVERLLTELLTRNVRVRLDGDGIRCKAPDGVVPKDLAQRIRDLKPAILAFLTAVEAEIAWRIDHIGDALLGNVPDVETGVCPYCGGALLSGQSGKCVRCCLASAALLDRRRAGAQVTYPSSSGGMSSEPERLAS